MKNMAYITFLALMVCFAMHGLLHLVKNLYLGSALFQYLHSIPTKDYESAFKNWIRRLKLCISIGGEYFKGTK